MIMATFQILMICLYGLVQGITSPLLVTQRIRSPSHPALATCISSHLTAPEPLQGKKEVDPDFHFHFTKEK